MSRQSQRWAERHPVVKYAPGEGPNRHTRRVLRARRFRPDGFGIHLAPPRLALLGRMIQAATEAN